MSSDQWEFVEQDDESSPIGEVEESAEDSAMHVVDDPAQMVAGDETDDRPTEVFETRWSTDHEPDLVELMEDQHYLPGHPDHTEPETTD